MPSPRSNTQRHNSSFLLGHSDSFSEGDSCRLRYLKNIPASPKMHCLKRGISKRTLVLVGAINSNSMKNDSKDQASRIESPETVATTDDDSSLSISINSLKTLREDDCRMSSSLQPKSISPLTISIPSTFSVTSSVKEKILFFDKHCHAATSSSAPSSPRRREFISSSLVPRLPSPVLLENCEKICEFTAASDDRVPVQPVFVEPGKTLKVVLLGPVDSGKTSVLKRYFEDRFDELEESKAHFDACFNNNNSNTDCRVKNMKVADHDFKFQVWDFSSACDKSVGSSHYSGTHAFAIVIDLTNTESLERIWYWVELIRENMKARVPIFIIGKVSFLLYYNKSLTYCIRK
jgi:hypothetical protein